MNGIITMVCMYCKKFMGIKDAEGSASAGSISHGVCYECLLERPWEQEEKPNEEKPR